MYTSSLGAASGWPFLWEVADAPLRDEHSGNLKIEIFELWTVHLSSDRNSFADFEFTFQEHPKKQRTNDHIRFCKLYFCHLLPSLPE